MFSFPLVNNDNNYQRLESVENILNEHGIDISFNVYTLPKSFINCCTLETGLSDFHKMTLSVLKITYNKLIPKIIKYRDFSRFSSEVFRTELESIFSVTSNSNVENLQNSVNKINDILDKQAPVKQKPIRGNQMPFMNRSLRKAIMTRSRLRNRFIRSKTAADRIAFNKQRNLCVSILRKAKREYFNKMNKNNITDNKKFWKTVKPYLSNKVRTTDKIKLVENGEIITNDQEVADILNEFFATIVTKLKLPNPPETLDTNTNDPVLQCINKYSDHPSIKIINEKIKDINAFNFSKVEDKDVEKLIQGLDIKKATQEEDIPTNILKENTDIFSPYLCRVINDSISKSSFPDFLKRANITPVHKKSTKTEKDNYRPVSILSNLSKIFERILHTQLSHHFDKILSNYQCGFRKGYSAQQCLISFVDTWKKAIDKGEMFGALLTDLSKAFDCISHELLIAKLHAYGLGLDSVRYIFDYLNNRKQRTKINQNYSSWSDIFTGVPQGSILGPLLFNIYICDLLFCVDDEKIASYADDNTPYVVEKSYTDVKGKLEIISTKLFNWLSINQMKGNAEKCHFILSDNNTELSIDIEGVSIKNSKEEKLLGVVFDNNLTFNTHIKGLCKKAGSKISALSRITPYMNISKRRLIMNSFFASQFSYCPLIWMFHSRTLINRINSLQERCLRLVYNDNISSFNELLAKDGSICFHHRNIHVLAIELFKLKNDLSPDFLNQVFERNEQNFLGRHSTYFKSRKISSTLHGSESLSYLGPRIWELLPDSLKNASNLTTFKNQIKKWAPEKFPCRICRRYVQGIGFVNIVTV